MTHKNDDKLSEALLEAVYDGEVSDARALLEHGADPNWVDPGTEASCIELTFGEENTDMLELLLSFGANPNMVVAGWPILVIATDVAIDAVIQGAQEIDTRFIRLLVQNGARADMATDRGLTAAGMAATYGFREDNVEERFVRAVGNRDLSLPVGEIVQKSDY